MEIADYISFFEAEIMPCENELRKYIYSRSGNRNLIDDFVQDTYMTAWVEREKLLHADNHIAYMKAISHSKITKYKQNDFKISNMLERFYHEDRYTQQDYENVNAIGNTVQRANDIEILRQAIDELPEKLQIVLYLYYKEECNFSEVAALQEVSIRTIYDRYSKALVLLRKSLDRKGIHISDVTLRSWLFVAFRQL